MWNITYAQTSCCTARINATHSNKLDDTIQILYVHVCLLNQAKFSSWQKSYSCLQFIISIPLYTGGVYWSAPSHYLNQSKNIQLEQTSVKF